jgi:hypothetical protein
VRTALLSEHGILEKVRYAQLTLLLFLGSCQSNAIKVKGGQPSFSLPTDFIIIAISHHNGTDKQ